MMDMFLSTSGEPPTNRIQLFVASDYFFLFIHQDVLSVQVLQELSEEEKAPVVGWGCTACTLHQKTATPPSLSTHHPPPTSSRCNADENAPGFTPSITKLKHFHFIKANICIGQTKVEVREDIWVLSVPFHPSATKFQPMLRDGKP